MLRKCYVVWARVRMARGWVGGPGGPTAERERGNVERGERGDRRGGIRKDAARWCKVKWRAPQRRGGRLGRDGGAVLGMREWRRLRRGGRSERRSQEHAAGGSDSPRRRPESRGKRTCLQGGQEKRGGRAPNGHRVVCDRASGCLRFGCAGACWDSRRARVCKCNVKRTYACAVPSKGRSGAIGAALASGVRS